METNMPMLGVICIFTPIPGETNRLKSGFLLDKEYFSLVSTLFSPNNPNPPKRRLTNGENRLSRNRKPVFFMMAVSDSTTNGKPLIDEDFMQVTCGNALVAIFT